MHIRSTRPLGVLVVLVFCTAAPAASVVREAAGADAAAIQATVDLFRNDLGGGAPNANNPVSLPSGRREINWDGVPDAFASPNAFPGDFFNGNVPGRARGIEFTLTGPGSFEVSANAVNPTATPVRFGNLNASHTTSFGTFSPERLFGSLDNNVYDIHFFIPGTTTPAVVSGFGAVFTDVDTAGSTRLEFFGPGDVPLVARDVLAGPTSDASLSFLGVSFNAGEEVARVRVTQGNLALNQSGVEDFVAADDFIFGEPQLQAVPPVIPLPAAAWMALTGALPLAWALRRACRG